MSYSAVLKSVSTRSAMAIEILRHILGMHIGSLEIMILILAPSLKVKNNNWQTEIERDYKVIGIANRFRTEQIYIRNTNQQSPICKNPRLQPTKL